MTSASARGLQLLLDLLRKNLAQLHTPLVEGVDVPDSTLSEGEVLIVRDQSSKSGGSDLLSQDRSGGAVSKEGLVGDQVVGGTFSLDLLGGLTNHQGLRLSKEVGCEHTLVLATLNRVVGLSSHDEVRWDKLGALVEQLEETVLGVGGRLAKQDGAGGVLDVFTRAGNGLAVALHGELLQVGGESVQVLIERRNQVSLGTEEVTVPHTQQTANGGNVLLQGSFSEVLVHGLGTSQELVEVVVTDVKGNGETDGAPDGVATTHPGFEAEHVLLVNAKLGDLGLVGGKGNKVLGDMRFILCSFEEPLLGAVRVGSGLCGGEGLGSDQEEGSFRVGVLESLGNVSSINIGDKVQLHVRSTIWFQGLGDHNRTTITAVSDIWSFEASRRELTDQNHRYQC